MGAPPKELTVELFRNSEAPLAITVEYPEPGLTMVQPPEPENVTEPPEMFKLPLKVFWPLLENVTAPPDTFTRLLKLFPALLLKARLPAPDFVSEPLAAK